MKNLSGRWKLVPQGSDYFPGIDNMNDGPLILKLLGNNDIEFYRIEKRKTVDIEELQFTYVTKGISMSKSYQVGILNYESVVGNSVILGIIQNCDDLFNEFSLVRLGPKPGQSSREIFRLDPGTDRVKLQIDLTTFEGTRISMTKYLVRFDEKEVVENIVFKHAVHSSGWKLFEFWESSVLSSAQTKIVKAVKIKAQSMQNQTETKLLETIWNDPEFERRFQDKEFDWGNSIAKSYGSKNSENEEIVEFIVKVTIGESFWFVAHRYREFDALKRFILAQNPYNNEFQAMANRFPGKGMGIAMRKGALDKRVEGLENFLTFHLENARFCRQNSVDALLSFLQIPENMHRIAQAKAASEPPPPPAQVVGKYNSGAIAAPPLKAEHKEKSKTFMGFLGGSTAKDAPAPQKEKAAAPAPAASAPASNGKAQPAPVAAAAPAPAPAAKPAAVPPPAAKPAAVAPVPTPASDAPPTNFFEPALTPAQLRLARRLTRGIPIVKHGRQGAPKPRTLMCDDDVTCLIVQASDHYKKITFAEIEGIRLGSEIDPATSSEAIAKYNSQTPEEKLQRRKSSLNIFGGGNDVLFGTAILRRTCKPEEMALCISFLMENRTLDLQCTNIEDLNFLYNNMKEILATKRA